MSEKKRTKSVGFVGDGLGTRAVILAVPRRVCGYKVLVARGRCLVRDYSGGVVRYVEIDGPGKNVLGIFHGSGGVIVMKMRKPLYLEVDCDTGDEAVSTVISSMIFADFRRGGVKL